MLLLQVDQMCSCMCKVCNNHFLSMRISSNRCLMKSRLQISIKILQIEKTAKGKMNKNKNLMMKTITIFILSNNLPCQVKISIRFSSLKILRTTGKQNKSRYNFSNNKRNIFFYFDFCKHTKIP